MNFMDPQKTYGLVLGMFMLMCFGAAIMGTMVTSEQRSESGRSPMPLIFVCIFVAVVGWMFIDYLFLPQYKGIPMGDYAKLWLGKKLGK
ncbi:MAG: hypothetical protein AAB229_07515 [Candidatus Hydrogenedentota bacterium]